MSPSDDAPHDEPAGPDAHGPAGEAEAETTTLHMHIRDVRRGDDRDGFVPVTQGTTRGDVESRYYAPASDTTRGAVFVGGAGGGFDTPVRGWLYPRLCEDLRRDG